ncbi:unnamed protein product [Rotaria sp. Silwood2]|nr:unnamed protein product [Rotaria sp. Silwood2]
MLLGCALAGPLGNGKTELIRDLAKAMGLLCIVTSCDEGYEYMGLNGRLVIAPLTDRIYLTVTQALSVFPGCAQAGPSGNGKTESIKDLGKAMSVMCVVTNCGEAIDYQSIGKNLNGLCQTGAWGCFDEIVFEHNEIQLLSTVGIFVTMNPGYVGQTELLESYHYNWSLRSFKTILSMTGYLKRTSMKEDPEEIVLLRAFRHMNIPKFIYDDVNLFLTLLNDLFPNIHCPEISYENLNRIIKEILIKPQYILVSEPLIQQDKRIYYHY